MDREISSAIQFLTANMLSFIIIMRGALYFLASNMNSRFSYVLGTIESDYRTILRSAGRARLFYLLVFDYKTENKIRSV